MRAAIDVISDKGYNETRLDDIATLAEITTPAIYKHYKNKEDILFLTTLVNSNQFIEQLEQDLLGVHGPTNLIRKLIWAYLDQCQRNPKETIIILMECRSNKHFYQTDAYKEVKRLNRHFVGIVEDGKRIGEIDSGVNTSILRDLMFGAMDITILSCLVLNEIQNTTEDFEDLFKLFQNMIRTRATRELEQKDKKERLMEAALRIFGQKGYHGATISEIAKQAKVSDGIVYEYFTNKEDLLLSIANRKVKGDVAMLEEMFHIRDPLRKLRRFIRYHCGLYLADRDYLKLFLLLIQTNRRFYSKFSRDNSFEAYIKFITDIIVEGQEQGVFRQDINPRVFRNMILGGISHLFLRWFFVHPDRETDKTYEIDMVTDLLSKAISKKEILPARKKLHGSSPM